MDGFRRSADWPDAVREAYKLQTAYLARLPTSPIRLLEDVEMTDFHTDLLSRSLPSSKVFKTIMMDTSTTKMTPAGRSTKQERRCRMVYNHNELTPEERAIAIEFIDNCAKLNRNLYSEEMLRCFGDIIPVLVVMSTYTQPFCMPPLQGQSLFDNAWKRLQEISRLYTKYDNVSDEEPEVRELLERGVFRWIGYDLKQTPILLIDLTPQKRQLLSSSIANNNEAFIRCLHFCLGWGQRYLLIPGLHETANVLVDVRNVNPLEVLASQVRNVLKFSGFVSFPHRVNKLWLLNNSFHWRTMWELHAPMLAPFNQEQIFFYTTKEDLLKVMNNDLVRKVMCSPSKLTTNYPFPKFISDAHDATRVKDFNNCWNSTKAMSGCPWLISRVPQGVSVDCDGSNCLVEEFEAILRPMDVVSLSLSGTKEISSSPVTAELSEHQHENTPLQISTPVAAVHSELDGSSVEDLIDLDDPSPFGASAHTITTTASSPYASATGFSTVRTGRDQAVFPDTPSSPSSSTSLEQPKRISSQQEAGSSQPSAPVHTKSETYSEEDSISYVSTDDRHHGVPPSKKHITEIGTPIIDDTPVHTVCGFNLAAGFQLCLVRPTVTPKNKTNETDQGRRARAGWMSYSESKGKKYTSESSKKQQVKAHEQEEHALNHSKVGSLLTRIKLAMIGEFSSK